MKILTNDPVATARRINALASTYPMECAKAIAAQPDVLKGLSAAAQAELARCTLASLMVEEVLWENRQLVPAAKAFLNERNTVKKSIPKSWSTAAQVLALAEMLGSVFEDPEMAGVFA